MQNPSFDKRHYRPNCQTAQGDLQPSGYFKGQADLYTGNVLGCYYSYWHNALPKIMFKYLKTLMFNLVIKASITHRV